MPKKNITSEEWLTELARVSAKNDEGLTMRELVERMGKSSPTIREMLFRAKDKGWLTVGRRTIERLGGGPMHIPVYVIRKPGKR